jgi:anti-sigma B factor antagonist
MALRIESRPVGNVLVVQFHGQIVNGPEVHALNAYFGDTRAKYADVVMKLEKAEFIDNSGLGALVRLMHTSRSKHGDLKLSGVPAAIRKVLQMTNLMSLFEVYDSAEEAITAAHLGSRYSKGKTGDTLPRVLCLVDSSDVRALMREVLFSAGFSAVVSARIEDTKQLLKAMKAKTLVLSANAQSSDHRTAQQMLHEIDPGLQFVVRDENFATQDPGEAMQKLLAGLGAA